MTGRSIHFALAPQPKHVSRSDLICVPVFPCGFTVVFRWAVPRLERYLLFALHNKGPGFGGPRQDES